MKKFGSVGQYRVMVEGMKAHYDHYYAHEGLQHMRYEIKICTFLQGIFVWFASSGVEEGFRETMVISRCESRFAGTLGPKERE